MVQIELATSKDLKQIRSLWAEIFPEDSPKYLDHYFDRVCKINRIVIARDNHRIVGMIHLNPYEVKYLGEKLSCEYIVAVGTREDYRRQGIMRRMMLYAFELSSHKDFMILMPEDEIFYTGFGFRFVSKQFNTTLSTKNYNNRVSEKGLTDMTKIEHIKDFKDLFLKTYRKEGQPVLSDGYMENLYQEVLAADGWWQQFRGHVIALGEEEGLYMRSFHINEERKEHNILEEDLDILGNHLIKQADGTKLTFHEENDSLLANRFRYVRGNSYDVRPYMMVKGISEKCKDPEYLQGICFNETV